MKTFTGTVRQLSRDTAMVDGVSDPPVLNEVVTVGGKEAVVTVAATELLNDSDDTTSYFIARFR